MTLHLVNFLTLNTVVQETCYRRKDHQCLFDLSLKHDISQTCQGDLGTGLGRDLGLHLKNYSVGGRINLQGGPLDPLVLPAV